MAKFTDRIKDWVKIITKDEGIGVVFNEICGFGIQKEGNNTKIKWD
jgi:hypothetical protein